MTSQNLPSPFTIFSPELINKVKPILQNYNNTPFNYFQISHRSAFYKDLNEQSLRTFAKYFNVPSNYHIFYLQPFSAECSVPFNLNKLTNNRCLYLVNDRQSERNYLQALRMNPHAIKIVKMQDRLQAIQKLGLPFYFYTFYNKLSLQNGQFVQEPEPLQGQILVCNLNNCAYYQEINIAKHGIVIFEGGRGISLSGFSYAIVRKDLIGMHLQTCPDMVCYEKTLSANSIINTPNTLTTLFTQKHLQQNLNFGLTLRKTKEQLKLIKEQYEKQLQKYTQVVSWPAQGLFKFKLPQNYKAEDAEQFGVVDGQYLLVFIQLINKGKASIFVSKFFK